MSRPGKALELTDKDFIEMFRRYGGAEMSRQTGIRERNILARRVRLEKNLEITIQGPRHTFGLFPSKFYPQRALVSLKQGYVLVASDAHYWPGEPGLMHRALCFLGKELKPAAIILNGDVIDATSISRFPPIGWETRPSLVDEIEAAKERVFEIETACGKVRRIWTLGNHDARYERRLATVAPEYAKIHGVHLQDHFPLWEPSWSAWVNDEVVIKHRFKGGIHAPYNNTIHAGKTIVTGHLHSAKIIPFDDYNGTRYGVDTGCIADTDGPQFTDYTEDNPKNWRSAFGVFRFAEGKLLQPELVLKWDDKRVQFRGEIFTP